MAGREAREQAERERVAREAGLKVRGQWVAEAASMKEGWRRESSSLEEGLEAKQARVDELQPLKEEAEQLEYGQQLKQEFIQQRVLALAQPIQSQLYK